MGKVTVLSETIKKPLTFMGECAGIAYDSDTTSAEKNKKRGLNCVRAGHGRMWEFCDVFLKLEGYSSRVIREFARHVGDGLTMIQRSTRYCNEENFKFYTPKSVQKNEEILVEYQNIMKNVNEAYGKLVDAGISKEDAANILPLGTDTVLAVKHNARVYIDMAGVRLCTRAYEEYRELMRDIMKALSEYSEEWAEIVDEFFICKCEKDGYCSEEYSCGMYPKKLDK